MGDLHDLWSNEKAKAKKALELVKFDLDLGKSLDKLESLAKDIVDIRKKLEKYEGEVADLTKSAKDTMRDYVGKLKDAATKTKDAEAVKQIASLVNVLEHRIGDAMQNGLIGPCLKVVGAAQSIYQKLTNVRVGG